MPKGKDQWYGYNDPHFHKWFHRCWKEPGDPDASKGEIESAYEEWVSRGKPQNGNCYGPGPSGKCNQKTLFEIQQDETSARYKERFWTDIVYGDIAIGIVGTAGAMGWLEGTAAAAGAEAGPPSAPAIPDPKPLPMPHPKAPPIPVKPAA